MNLPNAREIMTEDFSDKTILIIEDNQNDFLLLRKTINDNFADINILHATDLENGYKINKSAKYDLVILDLNLPDGFGLGTIQFFKSIDVNAPVIAITGDINNTITERAKKMGAREIISKDAMGSPAFTEAIKVNLSSDHY